MPVLLSWRRLFDFSLYQEFSMPLGFKSVIILAITNALAFSLTLMMMLVGSLVGAKLAPVESLATLPIAMMVVGLALGVWPVAHVTQLLGRRPTLWLFMGLAILSCVLAGFSLSAASFSLFCLAAVIIGVTNAPFQQMRFAAMECVASEYRVTAASIMMLAGVLAAFVGPELAIIGRNLTAVEYQGSFGLVAVATLSAAFLLLWYKPVAVPAMDKQVVARPASELIKNPQFCLAVASAAVGFMVMTFVMTATPISMHVHHGHSLVDTKWVIQSHIAAMFLPSLLSPWLFRLIGLRGMMIGGLCCYMVTIVIGLSNTSVMGFWSQLVMLGIGWNLLFVAGTALLPTTYSEGEQFKAQAVNDGSVFSIQALASLSAGWAISHSSWQVILLVCLLPVFLMAAMLLWSSKQYSKSLENG